jgi:hypothetical protein
MIQENEVWEEENNVAHVSFKHNTIMIDDIIILFFTNKSLYHFINQQIRNIRR